MSRPIRGLHGQSVAIAIDTLTQFGETKQLSQARASSIHNWRKVYPPEEKDLHRHMWRARASFKPGIALRSFITIHAEYGHRTQAEKLVRAWIERNQAALKPR